MTARKLNCSVSDFQTPQKGGKHTKARKIAFNINDMNDITIEEPGDVKIMQSTGRKAKGEVIECICT